MDIVDENEILSSTGKNICDLPAELLIKIFSYLGYLENKYVVSHVCEQWSKLCEDPFLYRSLFLDSKFLEVKEVNEMFKAAPFLTSLTVKQREDLHRILKIISRKNKKIKKVKFDRCRGSTFSKQVDSAMLIRSLKHCAEIETLIIKNTLLSDGFERCHLYGLGLVLPNLRKLTLVNVSVTLIERELILIFKTCRKLESIKIMQTQGTQLTDKFIETICHTLRSTLKVLKMNGPFLTDNSLVNLKICKNLQTLYVKYALRLTDNIISNLLEINTITSLDLTMALNISTSNWVKIFSQSWMQNMIKIVIGQCDSVNDEVLEAIGQNCPILQNLGLSGCVKITESGIVDVMMGCKNMIFLDLFYTPMRITKVFYLIPKHMPKLKKLIFRSTNGFEGSKYTVRLLKSNLPDLIVSDTVDGIC